MSTIPTASSSRMPRRTHSLPRSRQVNSPRSNSGTSFLGFLRLTAALYRRDIIAGLGRNLSRICKSFRLHFSGPDGLRTKVCTISTGFSTGNIWMCTLWKERTVLSSSKYQSTYAFGEKRRFQNPFLFPCWKKNGFCNPKKKGLPKGLSGSK